MQSEHRHSTCLASSPTVKRAVGTQSVDLDKQLNEFATSPLPSAQITNMLQCSKYLEHAECVSVSTMQATAIYRNDMNWPCLALGDEKLPGVTSLLLPLSHMTPAIIDLLVRRCPNVVRIVNSDTNDAVATTEVVEQVFRFKKLTHLNMGNASLPVGGDDVLDLLSASLNIDNNWETSIRSVVLCGFISLKVPNVLDMDHIVLTQLHRGNSGRFFVSKISKILEACPTLLSLRADSWEMLEQDSTAMTSECEFADGVVGIILNADSRMILCPPLSAAAKGFLGVFKNFVV